MPIGSVHMVPHDAGQSCGGIPRQCRSRCAQCSGLIPPETVQESAVLRPIHRAYDALIVKCNALTTNRDAGFGIRFPRPPRLGRREGSVRRGIAGHVAKGADVLESKAHFPFFRPVVPGQARALHGQQFTRLARLAKAFVSISPFRSRPDLKRDPVLCVIRILRLNVRAGQQAQNACQDCCILPQAEGWLGSFFHSLAAHFMCTFGTAK